MLSSSTHYNNIESYFSKKETKKNKIKIKSEDHFYLIITNYMFVITQHLLILSVP